MLVKSSTLLHRGESVREHPTAIGARWPRAEPRRSLDVHDAPREPSPGAVEAHPGGPGGGVPRPAAAAPTPALAAPQAAEEPAEPAPPPYDEGAPGGEDIPF